MLQKYSVSKLLTVAIIFYIVIASLLQMQLYASDNKVVNTDEISYIAAAKKLYLQHSFDETRPLAIAALVGVPLLFNAQFCHFTIWYWVVQFLLLMCNILILYKLGKQFFEINLAYYVALALALTISFTAYSNQVLSEILFATLLLSNAYAISIFFKSGKYFWLCMAGFFMCIACLVRPVLFPFAILFLIGTVFYYVKNKAYKYLLLLLIGYWPVHLQCNYVQKISGHYQISNIGNAALLNYLDIRSRNLQHHSSYLSELQLQTKIRDSAAKMHLPITAAQDFKMQLQYNTGNVIKAYLYNLAENSFRGSAAINTDRQAYNSPVLYRTNKILYQLSAVQNVIISLMALIIIPVLMYKWRKKIDKTHFKIAFVLNAICIYIMLASAISFYQRDRFHVVIVPLVLILCGIIYNACKFPQTQQAS
jgi:hypothetical protein